MFGRQTRASLLWIRILRFTHQHNRLTNEFLQPFGLTSAQFDILMQIASYEPLTQRELAEKVTVSQGGVSRMLARLEKEGWIQRELKWKTKTISLTEKGWNKITEAYEPLLKYQTSLFDDCLTREEQKQLLTYMSRLQKHSEKKLRENDH